MSSSSSQPADLLEVGRIDKVHGLRGEVAVSFVTNMVAARTAAGTELWAEGERLIIGSARRHKNKWLILFEGVNSPEGAERLRGKLLAAAPLSNEALADGEAEGTASEVVAFVHELIGLRLVDQHGESHGPVVAVVDNPASDLLELEDGRLVPLSFYCDHDDATVSVDVPPGLLNDAEAVSDQS